MDLVLLVWVLVDLVLWVKEYEDLMLLLVVLEDLVLLVKE